MGGSRGELEIEKLSAQSKDAPELFIEGVSRTICELGFPEKSGVLFCYVPCPHLPGSGISAPLIVNTKNLPAAWQDRFVGGEGFRDDVVYHACLGHHVPFLWSDVASELLSLQLTMNQRRYMRFCKDIGIQRGYTIPIHLPGGALSIMTISGNGPREEFEQAARANGPAVFMLGHLFHDAAVRSFRQRSSSTNAHNLTSRELECLRWAANGKTESDIASILTRSRETVREHLQNAARKLNAVNRTHAVAKAILLGLVNPQATAAHPPKKGGAKAASTS